MSNNSLSTPLFAARSFAAPFCAALLLATGACGGSKAQKTETPAGDDLDETTTKAVDSVGDGDGDVSASDGETPEAASGDGDGDAAGDGDADPGTDVPDGPAVTFRLKNTWDKDLQFNLDAGWAAQILVFSGKPPKAVSILPFPKHCTASCDADDKKRCPVCKKPSSLGAIRKSEKRETLEAGKELEVPWDGQVHVYEKTKAKRKKCNCHKLEPVPDGVYTVRVCGLRLSKEHRKHSKLQCVDQLDALTFPADGPQVIEVDFGNPSPKKKKKKK